MESIENRLLDLKSKIDRAKTSKATLEGERKQLLAQLKEKFGVKTLGEAKKKLAKLQEEHPKLEERVENMVVALEEKDVWN